MMRTPSEIFSLEGRAALVAGGSKGIGKGIAEALAGAGADVVVASRHPDDAASLVQALIRQGVRAHAIRMDLSDPEQCAAAVDEAYQFLGRLDILVNSGGIAATRPALEITPDEWDRVLDTNLRGGFFLSQAAVRKMAGGGRIIHVASILGLVGTRHLASYVASKGGVVQLCKALALEWAGLGVTVNAIAPSYIETDMNAEAFANPRFREKVLSKTPLGRLGTLADVQGVALLLASDAGAYITGQTLVVDGGWVAE